MGFNGYSQPEGEKAKEKKNYLIKVGRKKSKIHKRLPAIISFGIDYTPGCSLQVRSWKSGILEPVECGII